MPPCSAHKYVDHKKTFFVFMIWKIWKNQFGLSLEFCEKWKYEIYVKDISRSKKIIKFVQRSMPITYKCRIHKWIIINIVFARCTIERFYDRSSFLPKHAVDGIVNERSTIVSEFHITKQVANCTIGYCQILSRSK